MPIHIVQKGDCITSIADQYGFFWETIWSDDRNAQLRAARSDPHTLSEGDEVFVPELRPKSVDCETAKRHRFQRKGIPALLRLQVFDRMRPRAGQSFRLTLDTGQVRGGVTDDEGVLCVAVPTGARSGTLVIGPDDFTMRVELGDLPPIETLEGVQSRLKNLGFYAGEADGKESPALMKAIALFQTAYGQKPTGEMDGATRDLLNAMHDERERDPAEIATP